jgi:hypothetical protein
MAKVTAVEAELQEATGVKPKKGESQKDYITRLAKATDATEFEDKWDTLSDESQAFMNAATLAIRKGGRLPDFPDEDEQEAASAEEAAEATEDEDPGPEAEQVEGETGEEENGEEAEAPTPKRKGAKVADKKVKAAKAPKAAKVAKTKIKKAAADNDAAPKKAKKRGESALRYVRELAIDGHDTKEIIAKLEEKGLVATSASVGSTRHSTLTTMAILREKGMLRASTS